MVPVASSSTMPIYKHENQRAWEHMQTEKQLAIERRRVEIEMERLKLQEAALAYAPYEDSSYGSEGDSYGGWWDGGGFIGSTRDRFRGTSQRVGSSPRIGIGGSRR